MGGKYGTCFDISVLKEGETYRMWLSWRPKQSVALVESTDGIHWSEPPKIVLGPRPKTGWEDDINRPCVLKKGNTYHLWYTGQSSECGQRSSWIGYATSTDGVTWKRMSDKPVLSSDQPWEKNIAVMCPLGDVGRIGKAFPHVVFRRRTERAECDRLRHQPGWSEVDEIRRQPGLRSRSGASLGAAQGDGVPGAEAAAIGT